MQIFNDKELEKIRIVEIDGEPWFVGKDVCDILGYANSRKAIGDHVDDRDKAAVTKRYGSQNRNITIINELGMYSLIFSSELPSAKKFKRWVFEEVLPSIRKHGIYITQELLEDNKKLQTKIEELQMQYSKEHIELICAEECNKTLVQQLDDHVWSKMTTTELRALARNGWKM